MSQEKSGKEVGVRWDGCPGDMRTPHSALHSIPLPQRILSPLCMQLPPTMHPSLGLQGLSRLGVTPVHHEIHQEAGQVAHGEVDELGIPARWILGAGVAGGQGVLHALCHQGQILAAGCLQQVNWFHNCPEGERIQINFDLCPFWLRDQLMEQCF